MALSTAEAKYVTTFYLGERSSDHRSTSLKRGSSIIYGETGCLSINPGEAHMLPRCKTDL